MSICESQHTIPANTAMLFQRCQNVDANDVLTWIPTLLWHLFVDTSKHPSYIVWKSRKHCMKVVPMFYFNQNTNMATPRLTLANVETMFRQCCVNVVAMLISMFGTDPETTIRQCCANVVSTLISTWGTDVETTFRQCCLNVLAMFLSKLGTVVETTFRQHCVNIV